MKCVVCPRDSLFFLVVAFSTLREYIAGHADTDKPLREWYRKTTEKSWGSLADIRQTFSTTDFVGNDRYVFDIKGNSYCLVAMIFFQARMAYVRWIGTHAEYDKIKDIKNL